MARGNRRAPPHAAPARRRVLRGVQPRRPLPAHHYRARCDALARGYRPSGCHAREGGSDEGRLLARRQPGRDARREWKARSGSRLRRQSRPVAARAGAENRGKRVELEGVAFSPDNRLLATPGFMGTYLWNARSGRQFGRRLVDKPGVVKAAAFSPDGNLLAVAGQDGGVRVWDVAKGDRRFYFPASQRLGQRTRVEPGRALPGGWRRRPDRARAVGERRPGRPPGRQSRRPRLSCVGGRLEPERTLAAQRQRRPYGAALGHPVRPGAAPPGRRNSAARHWRPRSTRPGGASSRQAPTAPPGSGAFAAGTCCTFFRTSGRSKRPSSAPTAAWS